MIFTDNKKSNIVFGLIVVIIAIICLVGYGVYQAVEVAKPYVQVVQETISTVQRMNESANGMIDRIESLQNTVTKIEEKLRETLRLGEEMKEGEIPVPIEETETTTETQTIQQRRRIR